ncbi:MAG: phage holin family protein [Bacilli bacterium]|nr:phage holin family protein [Bacilli bacterium]
MKLVTKGRINLLLEFVLYSILYTAAFMAVESMFESFFLGRDNKILYAFLAIVVIYVLEKVLKPILVTIATPITGVTFGLFYFVINTFLLKLTDWIMGPKLDFTDIWALFVISIVLALLNLLIEKLIIEPIIRRATKK